MDNKPLVSVIMGVYNTKIEYLKAALDSVLSQTYSKIEFIIINDASEFWCSSFLEDYCKDYIKEKNNCKIRLFNNRENKGLTASLNIALREAEGDYIARMDSDDVCAPDRIELQTAYLEKNKDIDVLACGSYIYDGSEEALFAGIYRKFEQERMRIRLSFANIEFTHPTVMFRHAFLEKHKLYYDETLKKAQDYNMWVKCIEKGRLDSLQKVLFISRIHANRIGECDKKEQRAFADETKIMCLKKLLPDCTKRQEYLYSHMRDVKLVGDADENIQLIQGLITANIEKKIYDPQIYKQEILFWWLRKIFYKQNWQKGKIILKSCFMRKGIREIIFSQSYNYLLDKIYLFITKRKWYKKISTEKWEQWM